jgi:hypothetical protein
MAECDMLPAGQRKPVAIGAHNRRDKRSTGLAMRKKKDFFSFFSETINCK